MEASATREAIGEGTLCSLAKTSGSQIDPSGIKSKRAEFSLIASPSGGCVDLVIPRPLMSVLLNSARMRMISNGEELHSGWMSSGSISYYPAGIQVQTERTDAFDGLYLAVDEPTAKEIVGESAANDVSVGRDAPHALGTLARWYRRERALGGGDDLLIDELSAILRAAWRTSGGIATSGAGKLSVLQCAALEDYVRCNISETIRLDQMANLANVDKYSLIRMFKTTFKQTPYQFVISLRVSHAKALMRTTAWPLTRIALECGFSTPSAFSTAFSNHSGLQPVAWRRIFGRREQYLESGK